MSGSGYGEGLEFSPPPILVDKLFMLVHNILPLKDRLASMGAAADGGLSHAGEARMWPISFSAALLFPTSWTAFMLSCCLWYMGFLPTGDC